MTGQSKADPEMGSGDVVVKKVSSFKEEEEEEETLVATPLRRVRVVAPTAMPGGYRLEVTAGSETFFVCVPKKNGGVHANQTFEATEIATAPITGQWSDDVFDCSPSYEGNFFCLAFWCSVVAISAITESLSLDWRGKPTDKSNMIKINIVMTTLLLITYLLQWLSIYYIVAIYITFVGIRTRMAFRDKYNIPGDCFSDCLCTYFCKCCSALQMYRHMKRSGDEPACCKKPPTVATIV